MLILGECSCIRKAPKQAIEWALDYHIIAVRRELMDTERNLEMAKDEYKEITGKEPGIYGAEAQIQRLKKEEDYYMELRGKIIELPVCDQPAFEVQK
ncbi:hypothetical protein LCGC14_1781240 [marine sediment metagenome]|uniref:Uncharacterized protein n=1 Tax=marine sediment metagenome TaxID=412755 RepID=A0A0F9JAC9_9ZZZZ